MEKKPLINQKIFTGGKLINDRLSAINLVAAGRQNLNDSEQSILYQAAQAYFDYLKTEQIVKLQQNNFEVLSERLEATKRKVEACISREGLQLWFFPWRTSVPPPTADLAP